MPIYLPSFKEDRLNFCRQRSRKVNERSKLADSLDTSIQEKFWKESTELKLQMKNFTTPRIPITILIAFYKFDTSPVLQNKNAHSHKPSLHLLFYLYRRAVQPSMNIRNMLIKLATLGWKKQLGEQQKSAEQWIRSHLSMAQ